MEINSSIIDPSHNISVWSISAGCSLSCLAKKFETIEIGTIYSSGGRMSRFLGYEVLNPFFLLNTRGFHLRIACFRGILYPLHPSSAAHDPQAVDSSPCATKKKSKTKLLHACTLQKQTRPFWRGTHVLLSLAVFPIMKRPRLQGRISDL